MHRSLYTEIDLPDKATVTAVKQRLADISEGRAGSFSLDQKTIDLVVSVLTDAGRKDLYDQILDSVSRRDRQLPRIRNPKKVTAIEQLCAELGMELQETGRGKHFISIVSQEPAQGDALGHQIVVREFRGIRLEFSTRRYTVVPVRNRLVVQTRTGDGELFEFDLFWNGRYTNVPTAGEDGSLLLLSGLGFATKQELVPIAFLSDLGNLAGCLNGADLIFGKRSKEVAELLGVRDRPDRVSRAFSDFYSVAAESFCELGCEVDVNSVTTEFAKLAPLYHGSPNANRILTAMRSFLFLSR